MSAGAPLLAVVIPTRDRRAILAETLARLARHAAGQPIEVIVVDDGSRDDTISSVGAFASEAPWPVRILESGARGPAAARNLGTREATAGACLYIGDDSLPTPSLIAGHLAFHAARPDPEDALLGLVVPAPPLDRSRFIRWLHEDGTQFGYASLEPGPAVPAACFWTSNVSVKRDLILAVGGFDEGFPGAACEDAELGFRLARAGMRLHFDPATVSMHFHPTDLARTLVRMRGVGVAYRRLCDLAPEIRAPRRPALRHRAKAAGLTAAMLAGRPDWARTASWRFLCDEVQREAFWGGGEGMEGPRIGRRLARLTAADPVSNPPLAEAPLPA
jgi:GT2 family glycosyltransferase